jgi:uncharacterized protein (UPF0276 family)
MFTQKIHLFINFSGLNMVTDISLSINNLREFDLYEQAVHTSQINYKLPFVEILWDNYCHLAPEKLAAYLSKFSDRIALHIMWSKFLDCDQQEFEEFLNLLDYHVQLIQPLYVSDHLCTFSLQGVHLFQPLEITYSNIDFVCQRVEHYQQRIGTQLLLENYPSQKNSGQRQIDFFYTLMQQTSCGVLFDISNARVGENNQITALSAWLDLLASVDDLHCHVGSYSYDTKDNLYYDSHDQNLAEPTITDIHNVVSRLSVKTLCYEREYNRTSAEMATDLNLILAATTQAGAV